MKSFVLSVAIVTALAATSSLAAAAPLPTTAPGAYSGTAYIDYSNSLAYSAERLLACASDGDHLVLVNTSGAPIRAGARIRYSLNKGAYQEYRLSERLNPGARVTPGTSAHLPFRCDVRVLF